MTFRLVFPYFLIILAMWTLPNMSRPASPQDSRLSTPRFLAAPANALLHFLRYMFPSAKDFSCPPFPALTSLTLIRS